MAVDATPVEPGAEPVGGTRFGDLTRLKLGRYEVVRELGKGAMGIVYLAKDPLIGRLVALKTIRATAHTDDEETKEFQQRFIREAQAAGILNHPAIVTVHDIGQDDGSGMSFIAMEYVEGQNLKEILAQGRTLSFDQIGEIIAQIAEALDFAHLKGIVHRDVKPANIILLDASRAKITDFGIAKIASGAANLTMTGQFLGTPNYMAPEQVKGAPVDGRTDIFSLGICLYECLTRRKPFGGDSLTAISYKIVHEPFPPLHDINPQIPEGYETVVASCLAKDPSLRYQRARDLAVALRAVIRGERPARPADPILADETVLTREGQKIPTLEVPFPDAVNEVPEEPGSSTRPAAAAVAGAAGGQRPAPKTVLQPLARQFRRTVTNVRTLPLWRRAIPPVVFFAIIGLLVAVLIGSAVAIRSAHPDIPQVDTAAEARRARERQLREEGNELLRQGRVTDAYRKFEELQRLAPNSPFVATVMQKLNAIRQQEEISRSQLEQAERMFQEGVASFEAKRYEEATERLQESLRLNPGSEATAEYLKLARLEHQRTQLAQSRSRTATAAPVAASTAAGTQAPAQATQLTTIFIHPFTDGRIIVRAGADIVANEQLFDERPARFLRRASRAPRAVSVTERFPAKNADLQVWVTVPAQNITEHRTLPAVRFEPGTTHRLIVKYDQAAKTFSYELN